MKKLFFSMMVVLLSTFTYQQVNAQSQLKIGIGDGAIYNGIFDLTHNITDAFGGIFTGDTFSTDTKVSTPYLFLDYRFSLSEKVNIGAQVGYLSMESKTKIHGSDGTLLSDTKSKSNIILVMPGIDVRYFKINKFKMYGNAMAGIGIASSKIEGEKESDTGFVFQVNPVGVSYGEKTAVFLEVGVGASVFNGGVKFGF